MLKSYTSLVPAVVKRASFSALHRQCATPRCQLRGLFVPVEARRAGRMTLPILSTCEFQRSLCPRAFTTPNAEDSVKRFSTTALVAGTSMFRGAYCHCADLCRPKGTSHSPSDAVSNPTSEETSSPRTNEQTSGEMIISRKFIFVAVDGDQCTVRASTILLCLFELIPILDATV